MTLTPEAETLLRQKVKGLEKQLADTAQLLERAQADIARWGRTRRTSSRSRTSGCEPNSTQSVCVETPCHRAMPGTTTAGLAPF